MIKTLLLIAACLALPIGSAWSQEVVVRGFPLGVGGSIEDSFFEPYHPQLRAIADSLQKYPGAILVVTGSADGVPYAEENDARNPSVALGRAHVLRNLLVDRFGADSLRVIVQSVDVPKVGEEYRSATVRLVHQRERDLSGIEDRIGALENRPPVEKHFTTEVRETPPDLTDILGLQFSAGLAATTYGGTPMIAGAITWKRMLYVEAFFGHTVWNSDYLYQGELLDVKRRLAGAQVILFPIENIPVGAVAGWVRIEEVAGKFYQYVQLSEGPVVGLQARPLDFIAVTGVWNPSKLRDINILEADTENGQFMLTVSALFQIGGAR